MYKNGKLNLEKLKYLGGSILHGVDATKMQQQPDLSNRKFDRIIFNFPHAGFHGFSEDNDGLIQMHRNLVRSFLWSAKRLLRVDGQIHVAHKTSPTYNRWDLGGLGKENSLICFERAEFKIENYPGYNNKRGAGSKCDEPFHLGKCSTFKFMFNSSPENVPRTKQKKRCLHAPSEKFQIPYYIGPPIYSFQQQLSWIDNANSPTYANDMNGFPSYTGLPARHDPRSECLRIFNLYFSYIRENFGRREDVDVEVSVRQALQHASLMYRAETERPREPYLKLLKELHFLSQSRNLRLQQKLQDLGCGELQRI